MRNAIEKVSVIIKLAGTTVRFCEAIYVVRLVIISVLFLPVKHTIFPSM